jgi:lipoyl(octanoyl) transferase
MIVRQLGRVDYSATLAAMRDFTAARDAGTPDELWVLEHPSVYTLGQAGRSAHLLRSSPIPVVRTDRGGQITYHGPGQAIVYLMVDLSRRGLTVRELVRLIEDSVIDLLRAHGVHASRRAGAPGVYVDDAKIAALGLRVRHGRSYHGVALNVEMDLAPYTDIDPCGYPELRVTQLADLGLSIAPTQAGLALADAIASRLASPAQSRQLRQLRPELDCKA